MNKDEQLDLLIQKSKEVGKLSEQMRIIKMLQEYFALTQEPNEDGTVTENAEWDTGFQAAIALIRNNTK